MEANIYFETTEEGGCTCYMQEDIPGFALFGYGKTPQEAKKDMLKSYEEIKDTMLQRGETYAELDFIYHYDVQSFFAYFDYLNISKVAEIAGINATLFFRHKSRSKAKGET